MAGPLLEPKTPNNLARQGVVDEMLQEEVKTPGAASHGVSGPVFVS